MEFLCKPPNVLCFSVTPWLFLSRQRCSELFRTVVVSTRMAAGVSWERGLLTATNSGKWWSYHASPLEGGETQLQMLLNKITVTAIIDSVLYSLPCSQPSVNLPLSSHCSRISESFWEKQAQSPWYPQAFVVGFLPCCGYRQGSPVSTEGWLGISEAACHPNPVAGAQRPEAVSDPLVPEWLVLESELGPLEEKGLLMSSLQPQEVIINGQ